jgi:multicomponent Na+:H+ antiporter subunit C
MGPLFAVLVGVLFAGGVYLVLEGTRVRTIFGIVLLGNAANLLILVAGRLTPGAVPLIQEGLSAPDGPIANPLAQALILTAIVIGLALAVFALGLAAVAPDANDDQGPNRAAESGRTESR